MIIKYGKNEKTAWLYTLLFALAMGEEYTCLTFFNLVSTRVPLINQLGLEGSTLMYSAFFILFLMALRPMLSNLKRKGNPIDIYLISGLFIVSAIALNFDKVRLSYTGVLPNKIIFLYLPIYIVARSLTDYEAVARKMIYIAYVFMMLNFLYLSVGSGEQIQQGYIANMTVGYQLTLCALIFTNHALNFSRGGWRNIVHLICAGICASYVVLFGSRGATVVLFAYVIYVGFHFFKNVRSLSKVAMICMAFLVVIFRKVIGSQIIRAFHITKESSRTLAWLFGMNSELDSSGRDIIYQKVLEKIAEKPFLGWGIANETQLIGVPYVHNLFLELLFDFGIIIGSILIALLLVKGIGSLRSEPLNQLTSVVFIYSICYLMFSLTYLRLGVFWLAFGLIMNNYPKRRRIKLVMGRK